MPECPILLRCSFFQSGSGGIPILLERLKRQYCVGGYAGCARFLLVEACGPESVPHDLCPSETERASAILSQAESSVGRRGNEAGCSGEWCLADPQPAG